MTVLLGCYPPKDCEVACRHVLDCQAAGYDDSDLRATTFQACVQSCQDDQTLNFCWDDCSPSDLRIRWQCATGRTDCSDLDHVCDVY